MKIIHIIPNLSKGGAERLCLDICNELKNREAHDVKLIVLDPVNEYKSLIKHVIPASVNSTLELRFLRSSVKNFDELDSIVQEFDPDIIHSHLFLAELYSKHINHKAKRFCHVHDNMHQLAKYSLKQFITKSGLIKQYERKYYLNLIKKHPTEYLCISKDAKSFISRNLPSKNTNCHFFPNAINRSTFKENSTLPNNSLITLCSIGSFVPKKGFDLIIHTIFHLKKITSRKIELNILGDGKLRKDLQDLVSQLNLNDEIKFHGKVDHPQDFLAKSDLYIHGASYEPFGLVLIEAMSTGLPVISTDGKGNRDFMDGTNGILLNHRDAKLFAEEILNLMEDKTRYEQLQIGALETAEKYDIVTYVDRLICLYEQSLKD